MGMNEHVTNSVPHWCIVYRQQWSSMAQRKKTNQAYDYHSVLDSKINSLLGLVHNYWQESWATGVSRPPSWLMLGKHSGFFFILKYCLDHHKHCCTKIFLNWPSFVATIMAADGRTSCQKYELFCHHKLSWKMSPCLHSGPLNSQNSKHKALEKAGPHGPRSMLGEQVWMF